MMGTGKTKRTKIGAKAKKGAKYICDACGMIVTVDKECACDPCDITYCSQDMTLLTCC